MLRPHRAIVRLAGLAAVMAWAAAASALPVDPAPALPAPSGTVINVSTEAQLQQAMGAMASNVTIVIAPGTYHLTSTLYIHGTYTNVGIRGATNNRDDVVLVGPGMTNASYGNVPYGIWVGGSVTGVTIANLTLRDFYYHPIILDGVAQSPLIHNVHLINAGQQLLKSNPSGTGVGNDNGIVEYSVLEFETTSKDDYTNGVDVHSGANWIIRNNLFRNIKAPNGLLAGPAVLMWNASTNATVEGNTFINCQREISMGLVSRSPYDNSGGVVRNNFIYRDPGMYSDVGIAVFHSPSTKVFHNTIVLNGNYQNAIEYRFSDTTGVVIENNLADSAVTARDGATGTVAGNLTSASTSWFVNPSAGDLHLKSTATQAIDKATIATGTATDFDGQARPQGAAADLGADEYSAAKPPAPPTNVRIIR